MGYWYRSYCNSEQAQEMHKYIRGLVKEKYGNDCCKKYFQFFMEEAANHQMLLRYSQNPMLTVA